MSTAPPPTGPTAPRYALYWAPDPADPLWSAGCRWLGRDPAAPAQADGQPPPGRAQAWRYGFHATLKAPMRLAPGHSLDTLLPALRALAARHADFTMPPLVVDRLGRFIALRPQPGSPALAALQALADDAVQALDAWRAPMPAAEQARRAQGLGPVQAALLARWGYPHVLAHWRFHLTLSDPPDAPDTAPDTAPNVAPDAAQAPQAADALLQQARQHFAAALSLPRRCGGLALFEEPAPGAALRLRLRIPLPTRG